MTTPDTAPSNEAPLTSAQMESMLEQLLSRAMTDLNSGVTQALAPTGESIQRLAGDFEQLKPAVELLQSAAEKVVGFDQRMNAMEEQAAATASKVEDFVKNGSAAPADTAENLYKKYGMIAGQAAIMVATLGAIAYNNRGTRVVATPIASA